MDLWISTLESILQNLIRPLEWVMLFAVIGGGLYLCFHSKGYPLLKIKTAFGLLLCGRYDEFTTGIVNASTSIVKGKLQVGKRTSVLRCFALSL